MRVPRITGRSNNGLHQAGREGVAYFIRRGPVVEARPAGEAKCYLGSGVATIRWFVILIVATFGMSQACGGPSSPTPTGASSTATPTPVPTPTPLPVLRVEPVNRKTFGLDSSFPAGTTFFLSIVNRVPNTTLSVNRCGTPCSTATLVQGWFASQYQNGDVLSAKIDIPGVHYLWARDDARNDASVILTDQVVGNRLRMNFDNGTVLEAWYTLP